MPTYTILANQTYRGTYIVEADSEGTAIEKLLYGEFDDCIDTECVSDVHNDDSIRVIDVDYD